MSPRRARVLSEESSPGALRRHLIAVTQRLVAAHGVGLTARQIAHEAQVADGALYNHFANKNDLVLTALVEEAARASEEYLAALPTAGEATLEENLRALAAAGIRLQTVLVPLFTGLIGDAALLHEFFVRVHGERGPQLTFAATVDYLRAEQDLGRASRDVSAGAVAGLLFGGGQLHALVGHLGSAGAVGAVGPVGAGGVVGRGGAVGAVGPAGAGGVVGRAGAVSAVGPAGAGGVVGRAGPVSAVGATGAGGGVGRAGAVSAVGAMAAGSDVDATVEVLVRALRP